MSVPPKNTKSDPTGRSSNVLSSIAAFTGLAVVAGVIGAGIAMPAVASFGAVSNAAVESFDALPTDLAEPDLPQLTVVRDSTGKRIAYLYDENRVSVPSEAISEKMSKAIIAIEDSRFYEHNGIDLRGTARAFATNQQSGSVQQGGSTITQQYVKLVLLNNAKTDEEKAKATERTPQRKLREASYAIALEKEKSKDEILTAYLNIAYFGSGAYGVEQAAQTYFSKSASKLDLAEAAMLAGVVQQPGAFDPIRNKKAATKRRNIVLARMLELKLITKAEYDEARAKKLKDYVDQKKFPNGCSGADAPYFCDYAIRFIKQDKRFGATAKERRALFAQGGLDITTTLDPGAQAGADTAVKTHIPMDDPSRKAAAMTIVQPGTGKVKAMAQNTKWGTKNKPGVTTFNYNVRKRDGGTIGMQAGSTFKVFTLATALEAGISPDITIDSPLKKTFYGFKDCNGYLFPPYTVENVGMQGSYNMWSGTKNSVNTFFIGLEQKINLCRQAEIAEALGIRTGEGKKLARVPSFPLGSNEVVPLDVATAFASFANDGVFCEANPIQSIRRVSGGKALYQFQPECRRVLSNRVNSTIVALLHGPPSAGGTGAQGNIGRPMGAKTGTTDNSAAAWFTGFTPQLAGSVWVGDPRGGFQYPMENVVINGIYYANVYGGSLPAPIFRTAMTRAHQGLPVANFGAGPRGLLERQPQSQTSNNAAAPETPAPAAPAQPAEPAATAEPPEPAPSAGEGDSGGQGFLDRLRDLEFDF